MNAIRSIIFNILFLGGSLFWSIALLWTLILPRKMMVKCSEIFYFGYINLISKYIMGIFYEIRGAENIPTDGTPYIIAAKHQSAYETLMFPLITKELAIILKRELTWIPFWGWYPMKMGMIAIDRGSVKQSFDSITRGAQRVIAEGRPILIFPQGTRIPPGVVAPYKAGLAKLYKDINIPIVPVALNAGVFWPKYGFFKKPGKVTFEFLPQIPANLPPKEAMAKLEEVLEKASDKLVIEAGGPALGSQN